MTTTNLGKVSVTPKGEYDPLITYERLDIISHNGSSYVVKQASIGVTPVEGEFYTLIAEKGDGGSFVKKAYKTYAAMDADKVNIPENSSVDVTNDLDESKNGAYIYDGVAFTRSQYDSKVVTDKIIADTAIAVQDAINNTAIEGGVLADTFVTVTPKGVGAVARNLRSINSDTINFYDFGAIGDGVTDDTLAVRYAIKHAALNGKRIVQNGGVFLFDTVDQPLSDGSMTAIHVTNNTNIDGDFTIVSTQGMVSRSIFGMDVASQNVDVSIKGAHFENSVTNMAVKCLTDAVLNSIVLEITSNWTSVHVAGTVKNKLSIRNCILGTDVTATIAESPSMNINLQRDTGYSPEFDLSYNKLVGGTRGVNGGSFVVHHIPDGAVVERNVVSDLGKSGLAGFDIDGIGRFVHISKNLAINCGFNYKLNVASGYKHSRDIFFHDNVSYNSLNSGFSIRSSCNARGNIAYNPADWGLYCAGTSWEFPELANADCTIDGFTVLWAGSDMQGGAMLSSPFKNLTVNNLKILIDPVYAQENPLAKLPSRESSLVFVQTVEGGSVTLSGLEVGESSRVALTVRPSGENRVSKVRIINPKFSNCPNETIKIFDADGLELIEPSFPDDALNSVIDIARCVGTYVSSQNAKNIDAILIKSASSKTTLNNFMVVDTGAAGYPTDVSYIRVGTTVRNSFDGSMWFKRGLAASAWTRIDTPETLPLVTSSSPSLVLSTSLINTRSKVLGKDVYNTTTSKKYYATGSLATDAWRPYDGSEDIIPV